MFNQLLSILQIRKEIPDAVGYATYGPISFPIPEELISELSSSEFKTLRNIVLLSLRIDNFSSKTQRNIRILYSGGFSYNPKFEFHRRRSIQIKHELIAEDKEIIINEIPPNESVFITIFNPFNEFKIEQVLLGENKITELMQKIVETKRYPKFARMQLITTLFNTALILAFIFVGYVLWEKRSEENLLENAFSGSRVCTPFSLNNPVGEEKTLERRFKNTGDFWRRYILSLNKVNSFEELKTKDVILWCEPKKS